MEDALAVMRSREPERLVDYIRSLSRFEIYTQIDGNYGHVGAILADAILQSNNDYERNVRSRIARVREMYARETSLEDLKRAAPAENRSKHFAARILLEVFDVSLEWLPAGTAPPLLDAPRPHNCALPSPKMTKRTQVVKLACQSAEISS